MSTDPIEDVLKDVEGMGGRIGAKIKEAVDATGLKFALVLWDDNTGYRLYVSNESDRLKAAAILLNAVERLGAGVVWVAPS